jgi:hypothetical protein
MLLKRSRKRASMRSKETPTVQVPRPGMPAPDSVKAIVKFRSPSGRLYQIIKTTEADAYDKVPARSVIKRRRRKG